MKSIEQTLKKWHNPLHGISLLAQLQIEEAMKEYATEYAREALRVASEKDGLTLTLKYVCVESILSESNLPKHR